MLDVNPETIKKDEESPFHVKKDEESPFHDPIEKKQVRFQIDEDDENSTCVSEVTDPHYISIEIENGREDFLDGENDYVLSCRSNNSYEEESVSGVLAPLLDLIDDDVSIQVEQRQSSSTYHGEGISESCSIDTGDDSSYLSITKEPQSLGFGPSAPLALDFVRQRASAFQCEEISCSAPSHCGVSVLDIPHHLVRPAVNTVNVVSFLSPVGNRIDVYYTTCTVVFVCSHPICKGRKMRLFKMDCTMDELDEFLSCEEEPTNLIAKVAFGGGVPFTETETMQGDDAPSEEEALKKQMKVIRDEIKMLNQEKEAIKQNFHFHRERSEQEQIEREKYMRKLYRQQNEFKNIKAEEQEKKMFLEEIEDLLSSYMPCLFGDERCCYGEEKWYYFDYWPFVDPKEKIDPVVEDEKARKKAMEMVHWEHQRGGGWMELTPAMSAASVVNMSSELLNFVKKQNSKIGDGEDDPLNITYCSIGPLGQYYAKFSNYTDAFSGPNALHEILSSTSPNMVHSVSFGLTWETYFIVFVDGSWDYAGDIPPGLFEKLKHLEFKPDVKNVSLGVHGEWCLETHSGNFWWSGVKEKCLQQLESEKQKQKLLGRQHVTLAGGEEYTVGISVYEKSNTYTILKLPQF